jgi:RNA polymerase sigma-70 factor (ECF subfamily)
VPIEAASDLEALEIAADVAGPEQSAIARDELRHLQSALDRLPPRAREVILLRRVEGLSRPEIAQRMGIAEGTVSQHLEQGLRALVELLGGDPPSVRRLP